MRAEHVLKNESRLPFVCCNVIHCAVGINPWARKCLISQPCSPSLSGSGSCKSDRKTAQTLPNHDPDPWGPKSLRGEVMRPVWPVSWWERSQVSHQYSCALMVLQSKANEFHIIPMMRGMVFSGCQTDPQGGRSMIQGGWRFERLSRRHGKLKSSATMFIYPLTLMNHNDISQDT